MSKTKDKAPAPVESGHETRDANLKGVIIAGAVVGGLMILGLLVAHWTFRHYEWGWKEAQPEASPLKADRLPPQGPLLQIRPQLDLAQLRAAEDRRLNSYGRDPITKLAHVPIDRAMELALQRGLPARKQAEPNIPAGPTESSAPYTQPGP